MSASGRLQSWANFVEGASAKYSAWSMGKTKPIPGPGRDAQLLPSPFPTQEAVYISLQQESGLHVEIVFLAQGPLRRQVLTGGLGFQT